MAYVGEESNIMRPEKGSVSVTLPVTFDYSGGRGENFKYRALWAGVVGVVGVIIAIGLLGRRDFNFVIRMLLFIGTLIVDMLVIRYGFFKEHKVRTYYKDLEATDYEKNFVDAWGIYSIDDDYPYYVRFRNGRTGLFVRLNKDVILGKYSESEYDHYEAIGDAYNIAGSCNISMCSVDCMDNVGSDDRLQESFLELENVTNPDLKDILTDMFGYLQMQMNERVTTYDVYVFTFNCNESTAWNNVNRILSCFMEANYVGYRFLKADDFRDMFKSLFNVHSFSVARAMLDSFGVGMDGSIGIIPIRVVHEDGSIDILNKTTEERAAEAKLKAEKEAARVSETKRKKKERKGKKKNEAEDEEFDLFK